MFKIFKYKIFAKNKMNKISNWFFLAWISIFNFVMENCVLNSNICLDCLLIIKQISATTIVKFIRKLQKCYFIQVAVFFIFFITTEII